MIGIFGGTFDPVHFGHLRAIIEVRELFKLTEVRLIPNKSPPHRLEPSVAPNIRLEMLKLAIGSLPDLIIDNRELGARVFASVRALAGFISDPSLPTTD